MPSIRVIEVRCKGCGYCIDLCPMGCLQSSNKINLRGVYVPTLTDPEKCSGCKTCEYVCPDLAIYLEPEDR